MKPIDFAALDVIGRYRAGRVSVRYAPARAPAGQPGKPDPDPEEDGKGSPGPMDPEKMPMIAGYAAVFDDWEDLVDELYNGIRFLVREKLARGAFDAALAEGQDVRGLVNHDPNQLIGRTAAGTLRLETDSVGLHYEVDTADTQAGRDAVTLIKRGDMSGSSFGFSVRPNGDRRTITETDSLYQVDRELLSLDLYDVSPVTYPAYARTTASVRQALVAEFRNYRSTLYARRIAGQRFSQRLRLAGAYLLEGFRS